MITVSDALVCEFNTEILHTGLYTYLIVFSMGNYIYQHNISVFPSFITSAILKTCFSDTSLSFVLEC